MKKAVPSLRSLPGVPERKSLNVPGKKNLAGFSFDGAKVFLTLNDEGECTFRVVE